MYSLVFFRRPFLFADGIISKTDSQIDGAGNIIVQAHENGFIAINNLGMVNKHMPDCAYVYNLNNGLYCVEPKSDVHNPLITIYSFATHKKIMIYNGYLKRTYPPYIHIFNDRIIDTNKIGKLDLTVSIVQDGSTMISCDDKQILFEKHYEYTLYNRELQTYHTFEKDKIVFVNTDKSLTILARRESYDEFIMYFGSELVELPYLMRDHPYRQIKIIDNTIIAAVPITIIENKKCTNYTIEICASCASSERLIIYRIRSLGKNTKMH
jgi:hypothetical protein